MKFLILNNRISIQSYVHEVAELIHVNQLLAEALALASANGEIHYLMILVSLWAVSQSRNTAKVMLMD
jgi:hypothetical protein